MSIMNGPRSAAPRLVLNAFDDSPDDLYTAPYTYQPTQSAESSTSRQAAPYQPSNRSAHNTILDSDDSPIQDRNKSRRSMSTDATTSSPINPNSSAFHSNTAAVNPATIPVRTSSRQPSGVNTNGEPSINSDTSPKKHRSMASVPEERRRHAQPHVDERSWLAQSKQNRNTVGAAPSSYSPQSAFAESSSPTSLSKKPMTMQASPYIQTDVSLGWSEEKENILKAPFNYLESHPGKDVRSQLIASFDAWLHVPAASLRIITDVVTMLHTASLLIDDVEDSSQLRRGVPVAHSIFGTAQTINSANYVYFCALQELLKLNNPEAIRIYTEELLNLHRGQGMDLFWRDTLTCPSEDDYLEMVGNKTGGLFRLAIKLMCAESPSHIESSAASRPDYIPLVNAIGLLFQILDDYKNLSDTSYTANKGLAEDLTEGKFSFCIIHAIRADPNNLVLINILRQKTQEDEVKRYAIAYMEKVGSFGYTRRVLRGLHKRAAALLDEVDAGRGKADGLKAVLERLKVDRHGDKEKEKISQDA